jgi:hypothetical protein
MTDPIALALRVIIGVVAAAGVLFVAVAMLAGALPGFAAVAYSMCFLMAGAVGVLGL